ncbi:MAG: hypothetical protein ABI990_02630 [Actinomycetota bacterium]
MRWTHARFGRPRLLTGRSAVRSAFGYAQQPTLSRDGRRVAFDCGPDRYGQAGTGICSIATAGGVVRRVVAPQEGPDRSPAHAVHHAAFARAGGLVFEADWHGEQVWALRPGARQPRLSRVSDDISPCVLPDGRIVSLWLCRRGGSGGHELRAMGAGGDLRRCS